MQSNFEIVYSKFNCTKGDPKGYINKLSCYISKNTQRSSISAEMQFKKNIKRFSVNLLIVLPRRPVDFVLLNLTRLNGCQFVANKNQVPLIQIIMSRMKQYGNLMEGCPFKRNTLYYFRGLRLDLDALPAFAFDTDMKTWFEVLHEGDILFTMFVHSRIQLQRNV